jgi:hypothetical protein
MNALYRATGSPIQLFYDSAFRRLLHGWMDPGSTDTIFYSIRFPTCLRSSATASSPALLLNMWTSGISALAAQYSLSWVFFH